MRGIIVDKNVTLGLGYSLFNVEFYIGKSCQNCAHFLPNRSKKYISNSFWKTIPSQEINVFATETPLLSDCYWRFFSTETENNFTNFQFFLLNCFVVKIPPPLLHLNMTNYG